MRRFLIVAILAFFSAHLSHAQRFTDMLDRGIVATQLGEQVFVSWRILPEEYYGTTYNLYKNGSLVQSDLTVSNWTGSGTSSDQFTVAAVVNGIEGEKSSAAKVWNRFENTSAGILTLSLSPVKDRNNQDVTHHYWPNDAIFADLDGDGQLEFIIKRINIWDANNVYPTSNATEYDVWEAYDVNWESGTINRLWWIDCGPNMVSGNSVENNLLAYDWDMDGKAEVVMRGADNMIFHHSDGTTENIGDATVNTRADFNHVANGAYTCTGNEYLIYFNGQTGTSYTVMEYPLKRLESGEANSAEAWDENTLGHPSSKYFTGAPYLDGRKPSIFLGRGIYMRHKMIALDVNPSTHALTTRWEWHSTAHGSTPGSYWFGNGNHNYVIADVDEDGRDEIIYGNMVIDDNGKGLNSTAYGHGDAMHVNDFDPYRKGLEIYNCIEDAPTWGMSYRSGLTGEIYKHFIATGDDGRSLAGNFTNVIPGSMGCTAGSDALGLSCDKYMSDYNNIFSGKNSGDKNLNFRIYWDGDLLSEALDGTGANNNGSWMMIYHWNNSSNDRLVTLKGTSNNGSKNNPCFQGDIIGDWREEVMMRASSGNSVEEDNTTYTVWDQLQIYHSAIPTTYPIYNLWADHQYRQAMGTQMQCYNLPPNASFFLGELEGITYAPPPLMNRGRKEVRNGGTISTSFNGEHVMLAEVGNAQVKVAEGAAPKIFTDNAPWWVQGNNPSEAQTLTESSTTIYTHTLTGSPFTGETMVVKQGGGTLVLPGGEQTYTGDTKVWAGTLQYDGKMTNSEVWLNRFASLSSTGGEFNTVTSEYGSEILPGGASEKISEMTINNLHLGFGSRVVFDVVGMNTGDNDQIHITNLSLETKTGENWENYGPENLKPVFQINTTGVLSGGRYPIGTLANLPSGIQNGIIEDVIIDGVDADRNPYIQVDQNVIYLTLNDMEPTSEPQITIIDMVQTGLTDLYPSSSTTSYYMPKVGIVVDKVNGSQPTIMGTFTSLMGHVTDLGSNEVTKILNVDFNDNGSNDVGSWKSQDYSDGLSLVEDDATYGKYIQFTSAGGNSRTAYWLFGELNIGNNPYVLEFDASITPGNNQTTQLAVMAGQTLAANSIYSTNYLFSATNGGANSTSYTINGNENDKITIPSNTWCHYKVEVDQLNRIAKWTITNGNNTIGSGSYSLPNGTGTTPTGIHLLSGRYYGVLKFDNLSIQTVASDFSSYTFTEPGTLKISVKGDASTASNFKTYTVENPYIVGYESLDYNLLKANNAADSLKWTDTTTSDTRWSNWKNIGTYTIVLNNSLKNGYIDGDQMIQMNGNMNIGLIVGYGISHNYAGGTTFSVDGIGDETIVYSKFFMPNGASNDVSIEEKYIYTENGTWSYAPQASNCPAIAKLIAYIPVVVHDELITQLPHAVTNGNAHIWRNGLNTTSTWASLVLPFDMTSGQVSEVFGENAVVANLVAGMGTATQLYFETDSRTIHANQPVLIKDVTKPAPYLLKNISSDPVPVPVVQNDVFQFIGNYENKGSIPFYHNVDYFFSNDALSTVKTDGTYMTLKGYRGYFHTNNGAASSISVLFDDPSGVRDVTTARPKTFTVYSLSGQIVRQNTTTLQGLPRGLYIVNGKKYLVK